MLRQPIIAVLGHVDHGKTSLLDRIRQTAIAAKEAGGITQSIGTTEIPSDSIKNLCSGMLERFRFEIKIPGLLFIDTPGHEAFTTLRKRGGSIADIAVLVVDINEGIMPQTEESIQILKEAKTPFVVAMNKIDRIHGWSSGGCFLDNYQKQSGAVQGMFEQRFYEVIEQLKTLGFNADRFDRITDFTKTVAAVPVSAKTGEGVPDLFATLIGISQAFLKDQLVQTDESKGVVLEVKELKGLGTVLNAVIYDGSVSKNDFIVVGGRMPLIAKIRALMVPEILKDIRAEKKFIQKDECAAACGLVIVAPGAENAVAGVQIRTAKTMEHAQQLLEGWEKEKEQIEIIADSEGLVIKADSIGSLEALINVFRHHPIKEATTGQITKKDVMTAEANKDPMLRTVIGFNTYPSDEVEKFAKDSGVKVINSPVIYHLHENYEKWIEEQNEAIRKKEVDALTRPGKMRLLPGLVFRASSPAIVGCEIIGGIVKPGYRLFKYDEKIIREVGEIKQIQQAGQNVSETKIGDKVAVSILGPIVGRQIDEGDVLYTDMNTDNYKKLLTHSKFLTEHEKQVLDEIFRLKRKDDPRFGL